MVRKTELAKEIGFQWIGLDDDDIHLNDFRQKHCQSYSEFAREAPHMLIEFRGRPFHGIFAGLTIQCGGKPDEAEIVTLEASSSQMCQVRRILDYCTVMNTLQQGIGHYSATE